MSDNKFRRWHEGTSENPKCSVPDCPYEAEPGVANCVRHGANKQLAAEEAKSVRMYDLAIWESKLKHLEGHPGANSLRDELSLLRLMLDNIYQKCTDSDSLLMHQSRMQELIRDIDRVLGSCRKLEQSGGTILDKTKALNFAVQLLQIVTKYVEDPTLVGRITDEFTDATKSV